MDACRCLGASQSQHRLTHYIRTIITPHQARMDNYYYMYYQHHKISVVTANSLLRNVSAIIMPSPKLFTFV